MRIFCWLDGTNVEAISSGIAMLSGPDRIVAAIYVIDKGPHHEIEHTRERFFRPPTPPPAREHQMLEVEQSSAREIVAEALRSLPAAEVFQRDGRPERETVNAGAEMPAH